LHCCCSGVSHFPLFFKLHPQPPISPRFQFLLVVSPHEKPPRLSSKHDKFGPFTPPWLCRVSVAGPVSLSARSGRVLVNTLHRKQCPPFFLPFLCSTLGRGSFGRFVCGAFLSFSFFAWSFQFFSFFPILIFWTSYPLFLFFLLF